MKKVTWEDADRWMQDNLTEENYHAVLQLGINIVGFEDFIAAIMADFANDIE